jgi:hypothetical protein
MTAKFFTVKARIRAHATLIGMVIGRLRLLLRFPSQDIPSFPLSKGTASEVEDAEPLYENEHSPFHSLNECVLEKDREPRGCCGDLVHVLQFLPCASDIARDASDGVGDFRSRLEYRGTVRPGAYHLYTAYIFRDATENKLLRGEVDRITGGKIAEIGGYVREFVELSKAYKFNFTLVVVPHSRQINNGFPQARYQSEVANISKQYGVSFLDLLPYFDHDYRDKKIRHEIPFDGHYDEKGNEIMAGAVASYLIPRLECMPSR